MKRFFTLAIAFIHLTLLAFASGSNDYILCINSDTDASQWSNRIIHQLTEYTHSIPNLSVSVEHMSMMLIRNEEDLAEFKHSLFETYGKIKPQALVILGGTAYTLRDEYREMWGDIPMILVSSCDYVGSKHYYLNDQAIPTKERIPIKEVSSQYNTTLFYANPFLKENIEYIKKRYPSISNILFVRDGMQVNEDYEADINEILTTYYPSIELLSVTPYQLNNNQLLQMLNKVDENKTAILFSSWFYTVKTKRGESVVSNTNLLISTSRKPIFTLNLADITTFGGGMHAGVSFDFEPFKRKLLDALNEIIVEGKQARNIDFYYPSQGKPYVLCNIAMSKGISLSDLPPNTILLNQPRSFFDRYKIWFLFLFLLVIIATIIAIAQLRMAKMQETLTKKQVSAQQQLIENLNMALKSASIIRWTYEVSTGNLVMIDCNMNEVTIPTDGSYVLVQNKQDSTRLRDFLSSLTENEVCSLIVNHKTPWCDTYKPREVCGMAFKQKNSVITHYYGVSRDISETYNYQQELSEKVELLETIKETMPVGVLIFDKDGNLESCNNAISNALGVKKEAILSRHINLFDDEIELKSAVQFLIKGESMHIHRHYDELITDFTSEPDANTPHGEFFEIKCTPIITDNGVIKGYVSICIDNTELVADKERIKELQDQIVMALDASEVTIIRYTPHQEMFQVVFGNYGNLSDISLHDIKSFIPFGESQKFENELNDVLNDKMESVNCVLKISNNWTHLFMTKDRSRQHKGTLIGTLKDITQEVNAREVLRVAKEKAEASDQLKSAFLANMSHEIRTPLNAIVGFSELLQYTDEPTEKAEYLKIINSNNELLLRLIGDILDLSKIEAGFVELHPETFDLSSFINETYATLKQRCQKKAGLELLLHNPYSECIVTLDKNRCLQIITNYINNAVKFTTEGYIRMGYNYRNNGIVIFVEDTGIGIPKEKQSKLFQRFGKLNDFAQGSGLGLSICKAIAERMNGRVGMIDGEERGSVFWAWLPCTPQTEEWDKDYTYFAKHIEEEIENIFEYKTLKKNILVVEENDSSFILIEAMLKECNLTRATTSEQAINLAKTTKYDTILMDMMLPTGGIETTIKIREFDRSTVIIALIANIFNSEKEKAIKAGCNSFVEKPIKRNELEHAISTTL